MRAYPIVLTAIVLVAAGPALAQSMAGMNHAPQAAKSGQGMGVITAIDPKSASLTIQHGPIPALGWPAMTMAFKANPPALLRGLRVGQRIRFGVRAQGMSAEIIAVRPQ